MSRKKSKISGKNINSDTPEVEFPLDNNSESSTDFPVVGIGASAGGLHVLKSFFSHMPEQPNMAFVIVQHLDPIMRWYASMLQQLWFSFW